MTFPETTLLLQSYLNEQEGIDELLLGYVVARGPKNTRRAVAEMRELLASPMSENDLTEFVTTQCLFLVGGTGRATLEYITQKLEELLTEKSLSTM